MNQHHPNSTYDGPLVMGVGASAGGLEAFLLLVSGLPADHNMVTVLVQHLDPDHESLMPELIAAKTKAPVHSVSDEMQVQAGHIYIIPPGYEMRIEKDVLHLEPFERPRGLRRPIDRFFKSLAESHGQNSIAVVLSGTGSDGAEGAREVKGAGGLVFVQDPEQAKYDGMPQSVLDHGGADVVMKAEEIGEVVRDYFSFTAGITPELMDDKEFMERVMRHVRFRTGHDFVNYKPGTMLRRIAVRMSVLNLSDPSEYLKYLVEHKDEARLLFRDLLINVTSFFRDKDHFKALEQEIIPKIVANVEDDGEIRIWVAGCSTGEEAYSIAMLLAEELSRTKKLCRIVIFATDIDEAALATARAGRYTNSIIDTIPPALIDRYFRPTNDGYEVAPVLREMVRFSMHSFIKDPPFSKLDLVACRNVLIYFDDHLQKLSMRVFRYALLPEGHIFLGPSENPAGIDENFDEVFSRAKIYKRVPGQAKPVNFGALTGVTSASMLSLAKKDEQISNDADYESQLLRNHAPAHILVDRNGQVTFTSENATKYLSIRAGRVQMKIQNVIAPALESEVRRLINTTETVGQIQERDFQGDLGGVPVRIVLACEKLPDNSYLLVLHDKLNLRDDRSGNMSENDPQTNAYFNQLEDELDLARQKLRTTVEELETSNEELKSSNEEMMSMNEELQSANEELTTINDELQEKLRELNQVNLDLQNYIASTRIPTVFLDNDLRLRSFTPETDEFFNFTLKDIDRSIEELTAGIDHERLIALCRKTADDRIEREAEFATKDKQTYVSARIMPYSTDGKSEDGVVFTLQDVTELREAIIEADLQKEIATQRSGELEHLYNTSPMAMGLIDSEMRYVRLNDGLARINGVNLEDHIGRTIRDVIPAVAKDTETLVRKVLETGEAIHGQRVVGSTRDKPNETHIWESDWSPFKTAAGVIGVNVTVRDITKEVETSESLRRVLRELEHRVKNMLANVNALVNRARAEVKSDQQVYEKLSSRINGLAQTHALLTASKWSSAALEDIIRSETSDVYGDDRVNLDGPKIRVNSRATLAIGMAVHELATNAAKYGAFSEPEGRVTVSWSRVSDSKSDRLVIIWEETGGPKVTAPDKKGFGSQLIQSTITGSLEGSFDVKWEPDGLHCVIAVNYDMVDDSNVPKDPTS